MSNWKCSVCGFEVRAGNSPGECPVCGADRTKFDRLGDNGTKGRNSEALESGADKQWKCLVCGYIHTGPEPPHTCPICGADKSQFVPVEDAPAKRPETGHAATPDRISSATAEVHAQTTIARTRHSIFQLSARMELITRLHGHPIAVHIPNGVLPLSVLFTLIAVASNSQAFATAAAYNMAFVCLSMPIVLITGFIDWYNRFNARWAKIFTIKFICGLGVSALSLIITLVWFATPDIYTTISTRLMIFLALNVINLITAATAGFYGGKLVFNKSTANVKKGV